MDNQSNELFYNDFDFKNSAIIQPPEKIQKEKKLTKVKYVLIDSRDRNILQYPNSNKFTIYLDEVIKDVLEIELISAYVPNTGYTINKNNCFIYSSIDMSGSAVVDTAISKTKGLLGYWTSTKDDIVALLNILGPLLCYTGMLTATTNTNSSNYLLYGNSPIGPYISYSPRTKKITIKPKSDVFFVDSEKNYLTKSMGELLGFRKNIIMADADTWEADTPLNLSQNDYILLHLDNFERFEGRVSKNNSVKNAYAKLHLGNGTRNVFFGRIKAFTNALEMNPTLQKLNRFDISFTDYYGNPYDFNNGDLSLTFAVTYKSQPGYFDY